MNLTSDKSDDVKFWREEKTDDAIYNVYLKKVRYRSSCELDEQDDTKVAHLLWQTHKQRIIRAGTLECIVDSLFLENGELDSAHVNIFLATYRTFATLEDVVTILIRKYKLLEPVEDETVNVHTKTIRTLLSMWLDSYQNDFHKGSTESMRQLILCLSSSSKDSDITQKLKKKLSSVEDSIFESEGDGVNSYTNLPEDTLESINSLTFMDIPNSTVAEQLTYMDKKLFVAVIPHQCLGSVWSHRDRGGKRTDAPTVAATIEQFNAVSYRVIATILHTAENIKLGQRAKIIMKWIDIAQELRVVKNFSSLKAILSGLQSNSVYRLKKTWAAVSKPSMALFEELSDIFSEENNQIICRELLQKEGTAKFASMERCGSKVVRKKSMQKQRSWMLNGVIQGTVPYLGTFLTDLTMIDTAMQDTVENGLINFEKKRKEFEVIVQIRLLQKSAANYVITMDTTFLAWFHSLKVYAENESFSSSCEIEPNISPKNVIIKKKSASFGGRKHLSADSLNSIDELSSLDSPVPSPHLKHRSNHADHSSADVSVAFRSSENCVIKVSLQTDEKSDVKVYKSIMLTNRDHTRAVISSALNKYGVEDDADLFCVSQLLQDGTELLIPDKANVFYAMNNTGILTFVVRPKDVQNVFDSMSKASRKKSSKHSTL